MTAEEKYHDKVDNKKLRELYEINVSHRRQLYKRILEVANSIVNEIGDSYQHSTADEMKIFAETLSVMNDIRESFNRIE